MPRSRASRSGKITRGMLAMQNAGPEWRKYKRCFVCRHLMCVNNYPDRKPRLEPQDRIMGKFVCPGCRTRNAHMTRQFIRMYKVLEVVAQGDDKKAEVAKKVLEEYDAYIIPKSQRHLGRY